MPDSLLVSAVGCAVRVNISPLEQVRAEGVERAWAGAAPTLADGLPAAHRTVAVTTSAPPAEALSALSQHVTLAAIEARRGQLWMLHAAAVADEEGRVVVVIGPSGAGKTTAARALAATYGYVSDETVGIERDGRVLAYRKPLSVIEATGGPKKQLSPNELGLGALPDVSLRLAALVLLDRRAGVPDEPVVEKCELGDALSELVEQTSYLADLPQPLQTIAAHVAAVGGIRRVIYREATSLPAALAPLFRDPSPMIIDEPVARSRRVPEGVGVYRGAFLDTIELEEPDRVALLQPTLPEGGILRVVAGIGPAVWRGADGVDPGGLVRVAIDAYGEPPGVDAAIAVADVLDRLTAEGVIVGEPSWRVRGDVAWTGEGGRFVALQLSDLGDPSPVALEDSAGVIWGILSASRGITASALVEAVTQDLGEEPAEVDAEVRAFLGSLASGGLVERIAP